MGFLRADQIGPLEIFKIGIGPSSSHTVGPMLAAAKFKGSAGALMEAAALAENSRLNLRVELFGSLAATGRGHCTDAAICAGLVGLNPRTSPVESIWQALPTLLESKEINWQGASVRFDPACDLIWGGWTIDDKPLPHPNCMRFSLLADRTALLSQLLVSVGGGFIDELKEEKTPPFAPESIFIEVPYPFNTAAELIAICESSGLGPARIITENEKARGVSEASLREGLRDIIKTFEECINRGLRTEGTLPGGLNVQRRAKRLYEELLKGAMPIWAAGDLRPSVYAIAVNEENAAGGRVVTAPTNGSSGLIPGVWRTLREAQELSEDTLIDGLIVAAAIGALVKVHASISGAEVGCQGEVGTSCAMAAAGATAMLGGSPRQIEQAAEIGIEHHLGMTCDPINGLVQVPCIERNAMGAVKALNATTLALASNGTHLISLDRVLAVMKQTGLDMHQKYKETSTGGLALG